ncbi:GntR family transcriptional regulator [Cupriavidus basilensis]|uniref:GntR family transcriptional regulator n=1 Tax=Cupriavidus basilensis TaxID=68895 RepID=UPI0023E779AA|nr:GntR family transcriptional regulator [Cupriavidus basilensis]MDF3885827.1 GntR family transcriptional regulator [Cupriavidus basilensis]
MTDDRTTGIERAELSAERGVAQYQRLASVLRYRIAKGEYPLGMLLPPITQLAADLGVAVVTVRQSYELLSKEGLIRSQRGIGTHVAALPAATGDLELAINDPFAAPEALAFDVLEVLRHARVPQELLGPGEQSNGEYVCVRKLHTYSGEPFCYAEIYVLTPVFESLPQDTAKNKKLLAAVLDELGSRSKRVRQRMTVMPADFPLCDMLKIPFASPVAKMSRCLLDSKGSVLYAGVTWYRGDRYVSEIDIPASALKTVPAITEPQRRAASERKQG